ncbi:MAG: enoyl-CoA hydratase/isomerase family protein [Aquabacterium sp.]
MTEPADGPPLLQITGARATLTLNRPSQHNRIAPEDIPVIRGHLATAAATPGVRLLVLTGSGSRTFCSGYTLQAILTRLDGSFEQMCDEVERCPLPTLAALNGSVYGGACDLALACDWRIGVAGSRLFLPAARIGLHYYPGGLRRFTQRLGPAAAKRILLTGMTLQAEELLRIGYLQELVPPGELAAAVRQHELALVETEPGVVASMKQAIDRLAAGDADETASRQAHQHSAASDELRQRLHAAGRAGGDS